MCIIPVDSSGICAAVTEIDHAYILCWSTKSFFITDWLHRNRVFFIQWYC